MCLLGPIKYSLFIVTLLGAGCGLAMVITGTIYEVRILDLDVHLEKWASVPPITMIVIGSMVFVISFCGCCGAITQTRCLLSIFVVFLFITLFLGLGLGIAVLNFSDDITDGILKRTQENFDKAKAGDHGASQAFSRLEIELRCCGVNGSSDYEDKQAPPSCCVNRTDKPCPDGPLHKTGCAQSLVRFIVDCNKVITTVVMSISLIQVVWIVCAFCIINSSRRHEASEDRSSFTSDSVYGFC